MPDHAPMNLEEKMRSLRGRDDLFPVAPDIAVDMAALIRSREVSPHVPSSRPFAARWLRMAAVVALVLLIALATALAIPASRTAIADFFGIEGIRIEIGGSGDAVPTGTPVSIGGSLLLGERSTLDAVIAAAPFDVMVPAGDGPGSPDEVYLNQRPDAIVVGLLYQASGDLPEIGATGVGMLLLELDSPHADTVFVKKTVAGGGTLTTVMVAGTTGYWIENGVLTVAPVDGLMLEPLGMESRPSGHVLIWSVGDVTYRLETSLPVNDALRIAESLKPASDSGNETP